MCCAARATQTAESDIFILSFINIVLDTYIVIAKLLYGICNDFKIMQKVVTCVKRTCIFTITQ